MVRPLFFSPCDWEVAQVISMHATTRPRHIYHSALTEVGHPQWEHWVGKNPKESGFPYIIANEFICARLAAELGFLVPECQFQLIGEQAWFLSRYMDHEGFTYPKFLRCRNITDIPTLLLFDLWVCNTDRWESNLLISRVTDAPDIYEFVVIDHSHALFGEADLPKFPLDIDPRLCFIFRELAEQITSNRDWELALSKVYNLNKMEITEVVHSLPYMAFGDMEPNLIVEQILRRRDELPKLLQRARETGCFPNWL